MVGEKCLKVRFNLWLVAAIFCGFCSAKLPFLNELKFSLKNDFQVIRNQSKKQKIPLNLKAREFSDFLQ